MCGPALPPKIRITKGDSCMSGISTSGPQNFPEDEPPKPVDQVSELLGKDFIRICFVLLLLSAITAVAMVWILAD